MNTLRELHTADLQRALDVPPHELRAWMKLEPFASREKKRRSATPFSPVDVLFLAVVQKLSTGGFAPKMLQSLSGDLYKAIQQPVAADRDDVLYLSSTPDGSWLVGSPNQAGFEMELKVPLAEIRERLLRFSGAYEISGQSELALISQVSARPGLTEALPSRKKVAQ